MHPIIKPQLSMKKLFFVFIVLTLFAINAKGQHERLQANYIYNIVKYIEWPAAYKTGDFVIGVLGNSPITKELKKLAETKKVFNQKISIVEFSSTDQITKCHVLFISALNSGLINLVVAKVGSNATLIIGETEGLATQGAGINFIKQEDVLSFQLNEVSIKKRGLLVDSKLKSLAL